ncbi:MAG: hypothetical protein EB060_07160 [Proteobacteria bacterium]|nr:hypothetical protein [Pseudomonadota bacterium]
MRSAYQGSCIILPTKHAKSLAVAAPFLDILGAGVLEYQLNTDIMGTFSGEVERDGSPMECARRKCLWAFQMLGDKVEYCLGSEGSFGPHPQIPFLPCDQEILYFIDRKRGFELHMTHVSEKTNYHMQAVTSMKELRSFAEAAQFPSHALILRPNDRETQTPIYKDLDTWPALKDAFKKAKDRSHAGTVWAETDMRAQYNPSRMAVIGELATQLAKRLATDCPKCSAPGWGKIRSENGLRCEYCDQPTKMVAFEIYGCTRCDHQEKQSRADGLKAAPQMHCSACNP